MLSIRTLRIRRRLRVAVGDAGDPASLRAIRVHANFAEYVPLTLPLIGFCEARGTPAPRLHAGLAALVAGRIAHAYGVSQLDEPFGFRVVGVGITLTVLIGSAIRLLALSSRSLPAPLH